MHYRLAILSLLVFHPTLRCATIHARPSDYWEIVRKLKPGDTLRLAPGVYPRLYLYNLNGTPDAWIRITGPESGTQATIAGEPYHHTIEILNSSYLAIENLRIDSRGIPGAFGVSAKDGENNLTHDIRIEGNTFIGQNATQQTVAISTKTPTWGWIIRYNRVLGAGTGLYLGDSDGTQPFVAGIIEHNLIRDTIGYNMQIKDQLKIPTVPGMPAAPTKTIIRNNVFIKNDRPSPDGDRPNLLVGSFPLTGPGSLNMYEIYGNYLLHNHREALFQGSGRVSLHDNIFVDGPYDYPAVVLRDQNFPLQIAYFYNNTVYTSGPGVSISTRARVDDAVVGNLIFAMISPISGMIMRQANNLVDTIFNAPKYVISPSFDINHMNFYPLVGKCRGPSIDLSPFETDEDHDVDFNGTSKKGRQGAVYRGAYAGDGLNPGWQLQDNIKPPRPPAPKSVAQ